MISVNEWQVIDIVFGQRLFTNIKFNKIFLIEWEYYQLNVT